MTAATPFHALLKENDFKNQFHYENEQKEEHGKYILNQIEITLETEADLGANVEFHLVK